MSQGTDMQRLCEERLRSLVADDEAVLAAGAADEFAESTGNLGVQGQRRMLVVTASRLLLADRSRPQDPHEEIVFSDVKRWSDGSQYQGQSRQPTIRMQRQPLRRASLYWRAHLHSSWGAY